MNLSSLQSSDSTLDLLRTKSFKGFHPVAAIFPALASLWLFMAVFLVSPQAAAASKPKNSTNSKPTFSPPTGLYLQDFAVSLSPPSPSIPIVFTVDGSAPKSDSARYEKPIPIQTCTLIRARTILPDGTLGPIESSAYFVAEPELATFHSNLPIAILDSFGTELSRDRKDSAWFHLISPNPDSPQTEPDAAASGHRSALTNSAHFSGRIQTNIRGRASLRYPKRSYTLKLIKETGEDREASLLGMPKDEDWILYAPYPDKTLMRDVLAYEMSRDMGHWAPRTRYLEVFVHENGRKISPQDYMGVYVLEERIKRHPARVKLDRLDPSATDEPEITGGYIFKKDHVDRGFYGPPDLLGGGSYVSSSTNKNGFPTPPGGFPGDPAGFLPTYQSQANSRSRDSSESSSSSSSSSSSIRRARLSRSYTNLLTLPAPVALDAPLRSTYYDDDGTPNVTYQESGFISSLRTNQFYYVEPEEDEITPVQKAWLKRYLDTFESTLYGPQFNNPTNGYSQFIDTPSFIDYHLIAEVSKNVDAHRFSTLFTKPRGGPLLMSPIWDWNLSFGNCNGKQGWIPEYWLWPQLTDLEYSWFRRLFDDPDFAQRYVDRWAELRAQLWKTDRLMRRIDELAAILEESQKRNFERWPILGKQVNPNQFFGETYAEEVDWMKQWLAKRLSWIDAQFPTPPALKDPSSKSIQFAQQSGEIFYTLNGSDPRNPIGAPTLAALKADPEKNLSLSPADTVVARSRIGGRWSAPFRWSPKR